MHCFLLVLLLSIHVCESFSPVHYGFSRRQSRHAAIVQPCMKLGLHEKVVVIGVAADSGCGKSTFMRRLTKVFGGKNVGPLGGGFGTPGGWETNTLVSDSTTVICLDDYHLNDRVGRKVTGMTAVHIKEQNFDLMYEHIKSLKEGFPIAKPIYNHVNGTLDTPETVQPTPIVIIEGLHPLIDPRVRALLDFTIYLDISDEIKYAWKIQRDMTERGWTREQVQTSIEQRKPDFNAFVAPQIELSDIVISVMPSEMAKEPVGKHLKVKMIQRIGKPGFTPCFILDKEATIKVFPTACQVKSSPTGGVILSSCKELFYNREVAVLEMDGKLGDIKDFINIEKMISETGEKTPGEVTSLLMKVGTQSPGALDGTGLFQTLTALKIREFYESITGKIIAHE